MKVLIVNTSERTGGAAVAASRLMEALNNNGVKAKTLLFDGGYVSLDFIRPFLAMPGSTFYVEKPSDQRFKYSRRSI